MSVFLVPFHLDEPLAGFAAPALERRGRAIRVALPEGQPWQRMAALYAEVAERVGKATDVPVVASGDCTTSLGILAGLQRRGLDPSIVWFDAHGDFNTDETTPSGYLGGMPLAIAVGRGDQTAPRALGMRAIPEDRVLLIDARDLDPGEREALARSKVQRFPVSALDPERGAGERVTAPPGPIYLHLDIDVLDPAELPGLRFPVPGGVDGGELSRAVAGLMATGRVAAIGLGCTWWPDRVDRPRVDALLDMLLPDLLAAESGPESPAPE
jgi:arginase